eukprot:11202887-Lingulodinium_polyedra.AAC.1
MEPSGFRRECSANSRACGRAVVSRLRARVGVTSAFRPASGVFEIAISFQVVLQAASAVRSCGCILPPPEHLAIH